MVIKFRGQVCDLVGWPVSLGLTILVIELHQFILIGYINGAVDERESIWRIQVIGKDRLKLINAVTVRIAQEGQAIATGHRCGATAFDVTGDNILGFEGRSITAS